MPLRTRLALIFIAFFAAALIVLEAATYLVVRQTLIASPWITSWTSARR